MPDEATIDGTPIADIIGTALESGAYRRLGVNPDTLERYVAYVTFNDHGLDDIEELDIDATDPTDARIIAELALLWHYDPNGKIKRISHIPRGMMYL